jgi:hypothetical protein
MDSIIINKEMVDCSKLAYIASFDDVFWNP